MQALQKFKGKNKANKSIIPGFGLSMGITLSMLSFIVLIPLASVLLSLKDISFHGDNFVYAELYSVNPLSLSFIVAKGYIL